MGEHIRAVHDRASLDEAAVLIAEFGDAAAVEAATKANAFRNTGNLLLFSRWRQVERAVQLLQLEDIVGEIH